MVVTEKEAEQKWCPQIRVAIRFSDDSVVAGNAEYSERNPQSYSYCIASSCMMWRWDSRSKHDGGFPGGPTPKEQWTGYCGMGGKP